MVLSNSRAFFERLIEKCVGKLELEEMSNNFFLSKGGFYVLGAL
jgi:hypothetical protein